MRDRWGAGGLSGGKFGEGNKDVNTEASLSRRHTGRPGNWDLINYEQRGQGE